MMSIGLGHEKRRNDTVAENTTGEQPSSTKDMGDVRSVPLTSWQIESRGTERIERESLISLCCRRFLNRLLGVEVAKQNLLFNYFLSTLAAEIKAAKEEGQYSEGVSDLPVSDLAEPPKPQV